MSATHKRNQAKRAKRDPKCGRWVISVPVGGGYAFKMTREQACKLLDDVIMAGINHHEYCVENDETLKPDSDSHKIRSLQIGSAE